MADLLLVEDDEDIARHVRDELDRRGYHVTVAVDGGAALRSVMQSEPDVILLDLGLPDVDGLRVLATVRAISAVPVIVITARVADDDVVRALDLGADDYVTKPFSMQQLEARTRAVVRRSQRPSSVIIVDGLVLDTASHRCHLNGSELRLTKKEFEILVILGRNINAVVPISDITSKVWPGESGDVDRTFDVHLSSLRAKLHESAKRPRYLHRVRGVGLMLGKRQEYRA